MLLGVQIINFDVFDNDRCGSLMEDPVDSLRLKGLNALIGRNDTGKSCFLNVMSFLKRTVTGNAAKASVSDGRPGFYNLLLDNGSPCEFKLFFKLKGKRYIQYELQIEATRYGSPRIRREAAYISVKKEDGFARECLMELNCGRGYAVRDGNREETEITDEHLTALNILGRIGCYPDLVLLYREIERWFFCSFSIDDAGSYFTDGNAPGGHKHLNGDGSNVINVLQYLKDISPDSYDGMLEEIRGKIPSMKKKKKNLPQQLQESPNKLFLYLLLFRDPDPLSTVFIETPDNDLYHDMVDVLSDEMREFTIRNPFSQIIFTTHNPYIIETVNPKEIWIFSRDFDSDDDRVDIRCAGADPLVNELFRQGVGMGAIWYGGHLDTDDGPAGDVTAEKKEDGNP